MMINLNKFTNRQRGCPPGLTVQIATASPCRTSNRDPCGGAHKPKPHPAHISSKKCLFGHTQDQSNRTFKKCVCSLHIEQEAALL